MSDLYYSACDLEYCPIAFKSFNLVSQSLRKINTFASFKEVSSIDNILTLKNEIMEKKRKWKGFIYSGFFAWFFMEFLCTYD